MLLREECILFDFSIFIIDSFKFAFSLPQLQMHTHKIKGVSVIIIIEKNIIRTLNWTQRTHISYSIKMILINGKAE